MTTSSPRPEEIEHLLDAHLERLDEPEKEALRRRMKEDPALQAASDRLGTLLEPLDSWTVPPPSAGLVQAVLDRVAVGRTIAAPAVPAPAPGELGGRRRPVVTLRELLAVAACILLFVGVVLPGFKEVRFGARKTACANNLRTIFAGTTAYAGGFGGQLPYAGGHARTFWPASGEARIRPAISGATLSNSSHQFLLLRLKFVKDSTTFICAARPGDRAIEPTIVEQLIDFAQAANCSYDSQLMAGPQRLEGSDPRLVWVGDANPLYDSPDSSGVDLSGANSRSHASRGQNIVRLGGDAQFARSPFVGIADDDIWLAADPAPNGGDQRVRDLLDTHLVPGAPR